MTPTTTTQRPTTGTGPDAARQAATWLNQGAAVDSQRAYGTWHHYPVPPVTATAPAPRQPDPDLPGYLTEPVPYPPAI